MAQYRIEKAQYEIMDMETVIAEVQLRDVAAGEKIFLLGADSVGFVAIYRTQESIFDQYRAEYNNVDDPFWTDIQDLEEYGGEREEMFAGLQEMERDRQLMYRYLIAILCLEEDETQACIRATAGKCLDEIEIPKTSDEEEWEADMAEEDDEEE